MNVDADAVPMPLKVAAIFLAASGAMALVAGVVWSLFAMSARADVGPPVGMNVIFAIFSCVVVGIWGRWWYAQRKHF
jgi:branched-subunit amino acid ABC-type transport system permease component